MKANVVKYGLYTLSLLIGVVLLIGAYHSFFVEQEVGLIGFIATASAGILCLPFVFIAIASQSKLTREGVLKIAVLMWIIGLLAPVLGL